MQWKVSSGLAAFTSLFLFATGDLVAAQIIAPLCTDTISSWEWSFNSLGQNPCTVLANLMATCYGGSFNIPPLALGDTSYSGPFVNQVTNTLTDACWCNTVTYNLISACSECQGKQSLFWSEYNFNCTLVLAPSTFPNPVPAGTRVPQWVLLGIPSSNYWSPAAAEHVGDTPEILPGGLLDTPAILPTTSQSFVSAPTLTSQSLPGTYSPTQPSVPTPTLPSPTSSGGALNPNSFVGGVTAVAAIAGIILSLLS